MHLQFMLSLILLVVLGSHSSNLLNSVGPLYHDAAIAMQCLLVSLVHVAVT